MPSVRFTTMHRRSLFLVALACMGMGAAPSAFAYQGAPSLASYRGRLLTSELVPGTSRWRLLVSYRGTRREVPTPRRDVPFDGDIGPGPDGRPTVVFSRCAADPPTASPLDYLPLLGPAWSDARSCRIYEWVIGSPRSRAVGLHTPSRASDTNPAIWRHTLVFVRRATGQPQIKARVGRALRTLPGGSTCPSCERQTYVSHIDVDARSVVFDWTTAEHGWELRAVALSGKTARLLASGAVGGICGYSQPASPALERGRILFLSFGAACQTIDGPTGPDSVTVWSTNRTGRDGRRGTVGGAFPVAIAPTATSALAGLDDSLVSPSRAHNRRDCERRNACRVRPLRPTWQPATLPPAVPIG